MSIWSRRCCRRRSAHVFLFVYIHKIERFVFFFRFGWGKANRKDSPQTINVIESHSRSFPLLQLLVLCISQPGTGFTFTHIMTAYITEFNGDLQLFPSLLVCLFRRFGRSLSNGSIFIFCFVANNFAVSSWTSVRNNRLIRLSQQQKTAK